MQIRKRWPTTYLFLTSLALVFPIYPAALFANPGEVLSQQKIGDTSGGLQAVLDDGDFFGRSVATIGDLDSDGTDDLVVGTTNDDDAGTNRGAIYVLFMNADGTVKAEQKISQTSGGFTGVLADGNEFGRSIASLGDLDGDNVTDIAVGAHFDADGGVNRGAVWILFLNTDGTVKSEQKISSTQGGFGGTLNNGVLFGHALATIGDLDGDSVTDLAVSSFTDFDGGGDRGAVWILFLNTDGTVKGHQKISSTQGGFTGLLDNGDFFGSSIASIGDLNGDNVPDIAVGALGDDDASADTGAIWILFLSSNGTVGSYQKISATSGGFFAALVAGDRLGRALASLGDLDGDGIVDIAAAASRDDDGAPDAGAVWVLFLDTDGSVASQQKISATFGGFVGPLDSNDRFGTSVAATGDMDGDGIGDLAVGAFQDDDGGIDRGALYVLTLDGATGTLPPCTLPPAGMTSWWPGDGGSNDIVGSNLGSLMNGAGFGAGRVDRAFALDGIDDFVLIPDAPSLDLGAGDLTIDMWIKAESTSASHHMYHKRDAAGMREIEIRLGNFFGDGIVFVKTSDGVNVNVVSTDPVQVNRWTHVTVVREGDDLRLYIDGVLDAQVIGPAQNLTSVGDLFLGQLADAPGAGVFNGRLDEIEQFNVALTQPQIQAIVDAGAGGKCKDEPNTPPEAVADVAQLTNIGGSAEVGLTGSNSSDAEDGAAGLLYEWSVDTVVVCSGGVECSDITTSMSFGAHTVTLTVTDTAGESDSTTLDVTIDPADLAVFECEKLEARFCLGDADSSSDDDSSADDDSSVCASDRLKAKGEIGLPIGVNFTDLDPSALVFGEVAGGTFLNPVTVAFDVHGGDNDHWKLAESAAGSGVKKLDIDWKGARFKFDEELKLTTTIITSESTTLTMKYNMSDIGGAFSVNIDGQASVDVDAAGNVAADVPFTVKKAGKKVELELPFPLAEDSQIMLSGSVNRLIAISGYYTNSVGRFRLKAESGTALPDGASTLPESIALGLLLSEQLYPGSCEADAAQIRVYSDKWKAKN